MNKLISIESTSFEKWKVMPRWRGQNLAVHAPVVGGKCERSQNCWMITHLASGRHGGHFNGSLRQAIKTAKWWDTHFSVVTVENSTRWPMKEQWKRIIRKGYAERPWRSLDKVRDILSQA